MDPTANLIFGAVIDPSLSGQVSPLSFLSEWKKILFVELIFISRHSIDAIILWHILMQVSITLIATGFKRQEESEGRPVQVLLGTKLKGTTSVQHHTLMDNGHSLLVVALNTSGAPKYLFVT